MPASVKLQEEFGDDVQVIFVHCQQPPQDEWESFAWKMKWMGNNAMWTEERPLATKGNGLPECALIGVDGTVLLQGHPGEFGKKLHETVEAEIKKSKEVPAGTPKTLNKAWQSFTKGDLAAALAECDKVGGDDGASAKKTFLERTNVQVARAKALIDGGFISKAEELLGALQKSAKADADLAANVAAQMARLQSPELAAERDAAKAFASLVAKIAKEKPFEEGNVKKAQSIAEKFNGTKTAERAARFVALSKVKVSM